MGLYFAGHNQPTKGKTMNKDRRAAIQDIIADLENTSSAISEQQSDEQDYYENMPESFKNGEKGEAAQSAIDAMQAAFDALDEAISNLNDAISN